QIFAFYELYFLLKDDFTELKGLIVPRSSMLVKIAAGLMLAKILMQMVSAFPSMADISFVFKDFIIGYLHLVFLAVVVPMLLVFRHYFKLIRLPKSFIWLYLLVFATTDGLIFYKGFSFWLNLPFFSEYFLLLLVLSCLFPVAVGILFFYNRKNLYLSRRSANLKR